MELRYRVYSSSVELNKANYSPYLLCMESIICIIVSWFLELDKVAVVKVVATVQYFICIA